MPSDLIPGWIPVRTTKARQMREWRPGPDSTRTGGRIEKTFKTSRRSGALLHVREFDIDELARVAPPQQREPAAGLTGI